MKIYATKFQVVLCQKPRFQCSQRYIAFFIIPVVLHQRKHPLTFIKASNVKYKTEYLMYMYWWQLYVCATKKIDGGERQCIHRYSYNENIQKWLLGICLINLYKHKQCSCVWCAFVRLLSEYTNATNILFVECTLCCSTVITGKKKIHSKYKE